MDEKELEVDICLAFGGGDEVLLDHDGEEDGQQRHQHSGHWVLGDVLVGRDYDSSLSIS